MMVLRIDIVYGVHEHDIPGDSRTKPLLHKVVVVDCGSGFNWASVAEANMMTHAKLREMHRDNERLDEKP